MIRVDVNIYTLQGERVISVYSKTSIFSKEAVRELAKSDLDIRLEGNYVERTHAHFEIDISDIVTITDYGSQIWHQHPYEIARRVHRELRSLHKVNKRGFMRLNQGAGSYKGIVFKRIGLTPYFGMIDARSYVGSPVLNLFPLLKVDVVAPVLSADGKTVAKVHAHHTVDPRFFTYYVFDRLYYARELWLYTTAGVPLDRHAGFTYVSGVESHRVEKDSLTAYFFTFTDYLSRSTTTWESAFFLFPPLLTPSVMVYIQGKGVEVFRPRTNLSLRPENETRGDLDLGGGDVIFF